jgi:hypothetical protein
MKKTGKKRKLTEEEIDALVIADADDPSAWGDPIVVPASNSPRPAWMAQTKHLDLAAKFFVLSILHRLGLEATLTFTQNDNVDITIVQESGRALTVDVKTLTGAREWRIAPFRARDHHYVVFVWYPTTTDLRVQPTAYIVASERLHRLLARKNVRALSLDVLASELSAQERVARAGCRSRGMITATSPGRLTDLRRKLVDRNASRSSGAQTSLTKNSSFTASALS